MLVKAEFTKKPERILVEEHLETNYIWLRKNIQEVKEEEMTKYVCDEVFFEANIAKENIEDKFDAYFAYGTTWEKDTSVPSLEDRISALEDMMLALI